MKYRIEVDFVANACQITYYPKESFQHQGNSIEACNYRINQILEKGECEINKKNLTGARIYTEDNKEILKVNYRDGTLELKLDNLHDNFWIKI